MLECNDSQHRSILPNDPTDAASVGESRQTQMDSQHTNHHPQGAHACDKVKSIGKHQLKGALYVNRLDHRARRRLFVSRVH